MCRTAPFPSSSSCFALGSSFAVRPLISERDELVDGYSGDEGNGTDQPPPWKVGRVEKVNGSKIYKSVWEVATNTLEKARVMTRNFQTMIMTKRIRHRVGRESSFMSRAYFFGGSCGNPIATSFSLRAKTFGSY